MWPSLPSNVSEDDGFRCIKLSKWARASIERAFSEFELAPDPSLNIESQFLILQGFSPCPLLTPKMYEYEKFCDLSGSREKCRYRSISFLNIVFECNIQKSTHIRCIKIDEFPQTEHT